MRSDVIDDGPLEVGQLHVPSFTHDVILHSRDFVELESTVTRLNYTDKLSTLVYWLDLLLQSCRHATMAGLQDSFCLSRLTIEDG